MKALIVETTCDSLSADLLSDEELRELLAWPAMRDRRLLLTAVRNRWPSGRIPLADFAVYGELGAA